MQYVIPYQDYNGVVTCVVKYILLVLIKHHVCIMNSIMLICARGLFFEHVHLHVVPNMYIIIVANCCYHVSCCMYRILHPCECDIRYTRTEPEGRRPDSMVRV